MNWKNTKGFHSTHLRKKTERHTIKELLDEYERPKKIIQWIKQKVIHRKVICAYCGEPYLSKNGIWLKVYGFICHDQKVWFCDTLCFQWFYDQTYLERPKKYPLNPNHMKELRAIRLGN